MKQIFKRAGSGFYFFLLFALLFSTTPISVRAQGYYKDIFMDGGIRLTSRKDLPAARRLGMSIEFFASSKGKKAADFTIEDTLMQNAIFCGSPDDLNGSLLYPDGQPRFRMIYVNGGAAATHGRSLTERGRENVREYIKNGGSYVGTCAGMFLGSYGSVTLRKGINQDYLHIWPGYTHSSKLTKSRPGLSVEKGSPLLKYYDFGGDMYVDSVYHNNGGFAYLPLGFPEGTEVLMRYNWAPVTKKISIDKEIACWAWKENDHSGRVVLMGSHPESVTYGERLDLMSALVLYATEGFGSPKVKGELLKGEKRVMDKGTEENSPAFTKIGDKQYHHFTVEIPLGAKNIRVELDGAEGYDLNLFMKRGSFAFIKEADHLEIAKGAKKRLSLNSLEAGVWYIAVECDTTVEVEMTPKGERYVGDRSVLNGVPYSLKIDWD
ncbi:MAG: BPL-N domain-containing protein [Bacteroidales bacterium]